MNSMINSSKLLAAALCTVALAGCNAVEDVRQEPVLPVPVQKVVLNGTVSGLSAVRPVVLQVELTNNGTESGITERSVVGTTALRFGAVNVGTNYNITIKKNPFGRTCTIANGSGTATAEVSNVTVTCVRDATTLRTLTATIATGLAAAPPTGFKVTLTTEEGTESVTPGVGQTSITFSLPVFDPGPSNLPTFNYTVTASNTQGGTTNYCSVTNPTGSNPGSNVPNAINLAPTVSACLFTIQASVGIGNTAVGTTATPLATTYGAMQLGLKNLAGEIVDTIDVPSAATTTTFTFPARPANSNALYEIVVKTQPTGQFCTVDNGGTASLVATPPATNPANVAAVAVRCRNLPAAGAQLTGTYQLVGLTSSYVTSAVASGVTTTTTVATNVGTANTGSTGSTTTTTVVVSGGSSPGTTVTTATATSSDDRKFVTFFANGTFLYGQHSTNNGVENGFYVYDPAAGTIVFTIRTDTAGTVGTANSNAHGISSTPGPLVAAGVSYPIMTGVVKTGGARPTLAGVFGPNGTTVTPNRATWTLREPIQSLGKIEGAWETTDSKRVFVYSAGGFRYGFHMGVNGAANMQDACYAIENDDSPTGFYTRRGGATGCAPAGFGTADVPAATGSLAGLNSRLPGSISAVSGVPSPVYYTVTPGTGSNPDTLSIQDTLNDVPLGAPLVMKRSKIN